MVAGRPFNFIFGLQSQYYDTRFLRKEKLFIAGYSTKRHESSSNPSPYASFKAVLLLEKVRGLILGLASDW